MYSEPAIVTNEPDRAAIIAVDCECGRAPPGRAPFQEIAMAKGQQRGNKEHKKPKQPKKVPAPMTPGLPSSGAGKK